MSVAAAELAVPVTPADRNRRRHRSVRLVALSGVFVLSGFLYLWSATSSNQPIVLHQTQSDPYNELTDGFLQGELSIPAVPARALVHLPDPYDPIANAPYQAAYHDLSLYHGHLYLSWGPTPVITLFMPFRVLGLGQMPENLAALLYSLFGIAFALALLELLVTRFLDDANTVKVTLCGLALGASNVIPYLLRRPITYEVAIASAYCFIFAGFYFVARGLLGGRWRPVSLAVGSGCLGLAVGARFEALVLGAVVVGAVYVVRHSAQALSVRTRRWRTAVVLTPWAVFAFADLLYNFIRFHSPLQIGSAYQLAGFDPTKTPYFQPGYFAPSLYYYVFAPLRLTLAFPFVAMPPPAFYAGSIPETYRPEIMAGLVFTTPVMLALLASSFVLRHRYAVLGRIVLAMAAASVVFIGAIALTVPGGTMRYEADFASPLLLGALVTWLAWQPARRIARHVVTVVGGVFIVIGILAGLAIGVTGPNDNLNAGNPLNFDSLEQTFDFLPQTITQLEGEPRVIRVLDPMVSYPADLSVYGTYHAGTLRFTLLSEPEEIDLMAPHAGSYVLSTRMERTASAPSKGRVTIYFRNGQSPTDQHYPLAYGHLFATTVPLQAGLNRVYLWASFTGKQPLGAYLDLVNVYGLAITPAADFNPRRPPAPS